MVKSKWKRAVVPLSLVTLITIIMLALALSTIRAFSREGGDDVGALAGLAKALAWPIAIVFVITLFEDPIKAFLERLSKVTLKAGDAEATLEAVAKASALVGAAETAAKSTEKVPQSGDREPIETAAANVAKVVGATYLDDLKARVLWVDDHPENNLYLCSAFKELGITVETALSTGEALRKLAYVRFDVIISDMNRPPDSEAGYTLLTALRERGEHPPVIIYAGSDSDEHRQRALEAGATESTNRPQRVFDLVTKIIASRV